MQEISHPIPELDRDGLRRFGLITSGIIAALFGLFFPWLFEGNIPIWPWIVGGLLSSWAVAKPNSLRPIYRIWMRFGLLLSKVTTPIILGVVFFIVILPVALVMKIVGYDPMARRFDEDIESYRLASKKAPRENMENPF